MPHPSAAPPGGFDGPAIAQQAVGRGDGVGVHAEPGGQFPDRRQRVAGRQRCPPRSLLRRWRLWTPRPFPLSCIVLARINYVLLQISKAIRWRPHTDPRHEPRPPAIGNARSYDREIVHRILDEALICHLGYLSDGRPVVLPTTHARLGETLYLHGSTGSGPMLAAKAGAGLPVCVTATLVDGLVLARSALHHSLVYRSVVVIGDARLVDDPAEKLRALRGAARPHRARARRRLPDPERARARRDRGARPRPRRGFGQGAHRRPGRRSGGPARCRTGPAWCR